MFRWIFADGSWFVLADEAWREALALRLSRDADRLRLFDEGFVRAIEDHWERRTLPGRYGEEEPWDALYESRGELAREVLRRLVAPVLTGLAYRAEHGRMRRAPTAQREEVEVGLRGRS